MHIVVVGLNNKTAPVSIREQVSFGEHEMKGAVVALRDEKSIFESVIVSTCNRTELYVVTDQPHTGRYYTKRFLANWFGLTMEELEPYLFIHEGFDAMKHLFRVTSGLDSMIVGETQILGQVKTSFFMAQKLETTGTVFNKLFKEAVTLAKRAHAETGIGENAVSVSAAAVTLAEQLLGSLEDKSIVVIGAGETGELTTLNLYEAGARDITVFNRTLAKAEEVANRFEGSAHSINEMQCGLLRADIVISSTGAKRAIIKREDIAAAQLFRHDRPFLLIDIAVPRDIEPTVGDLPGVHLYDVDDLTSIVQQNMAERMKEAAKIERRIEAAIAEFEGWMTTLGVVPIITELRDQALRIQQETMQSLERKLPEMSKREKTVIGKHMKSIINQLLREPLSYIKDAAAKPDADERIAQFMDTFALNEDLFEGFEEDVMTSEETTPSAKAVNR
ncbi:glutamyl-tRNA reductase [Exiguobacterium acetylicum]|uniref:glutamyl-tRNA reductase n=1 Tax=Exiguobacterium acetylicum TaxID=41170 RepID=UPI001EE230D5|nr:glutamyl-tRNA reductase [Exiguobacterium acetylicum]UKS55255.1 glutamyl-tRNA reductase [Exiguobacterium acetylicum]